ncbi:hypothetical protein K492DRAFT_192755 [Lichtheimia hyalospora FSU 10163]|nr:hypothetical protein K492DRAFT_192755 [Lichtheimia hyalospora FSU 10163]
MTLFIILDKKLGDMNGGIISKIPWCNLRKHRHNHLSTMEDSHDIEYLKIASKGETMVNDEPLNIVHKEPNTMTPPPASWSIHQMKLMDATATLRLHSSHHTSTHQHKLENLFSPYDYDHSSLVTPEQLLTAPQPQQPQQRQISLPLSLPSRYQQTADDCSRDNSQFTLQRPQSLRRVSAGGNHPADYFQQRIPYYAYYPYFAYYNSPSPSLSPAASQFYHAYYYGYR